MLRFEEVECQVSIKEIVRESLLPFRLKSKDNPYPLIHVILDLLVFLLGLVFRRVILIHFVMLLWNLPKCPYIITGKMRSDVLTVLLLYSTKELKRLLADRAITRLEYSSRVFFQSYLTIFKI